MFAVYLVWYFLGSSIIYLNNKFSLQMQHHQCLINLHEELFLDLVVLIAKNWVQMHFHNSPDSLI